MITERGRIISIEDDRVWVETIQRSTCNSCSAQKGCGQSLIAKWSGKTVLIAVLLQDHSASDFHIHDEIDIGIPEDVVANGSLLVYLTPLFGLVLGTLLGQWLLGTEAAAIAGALFGLLAGGLAVRYHSACHRYDGRVQPVIMGVAEASEAQPLYFPADGKA